MSLQGCEHSVGICSGACMGNACSSAEPCAICGVEDAGDEGFCETCSAALNQNCDCPAHRPAPAAIEDEPTTPMPRQNMASLVYGGAA